MKTKNEIERQIEKLNAKINFHLERLETVMENMNGKKNDPEKFVQERFAWELSVIESDLRTLLIAKQAFESVINE